MAWIDRCDRRAIAAAVGVMVVAVGLWGLVLAATSSARVAAMACASVAHSVGDLGELDDAVGCYNAQTPAGDHTITLTGDIDVPGRATVPITQSDAAVGLTVEGAGFSLTGSGVGTGASMFSVLGAGEATFINMMIDGGGVAGIGFGGSAGVGTIANSTIRNSATHGVETFGGVVSIVNSTLDSNVRGVEMNGGTVFIGGSTLSNNTPGDGVLTTAGTLYVTNTTMAGNAGAGASTNGGSMLISNSTSINNAFGVLTGAGGSSAVNSVFAGNTTADCIGSTPFDYGGNFAEDSTCTGYGAVSTTSFGLLADNGCTTPGPSACVLTVELLSGNPAVDAGDCASILLGLNSDGTAIAGPLVADQRDVTRTNGTNCDAGAYETPRPCTGPGTYTVSDSATLNNAIGCYNTAATSGTFVLDVVNDISYTVGSAAIAQPFADPGFLLLINGNGHTLDANDTAAVLAVVEGNVTVDSATLTGGLSHAVNVTGGAVAVTNSTVTGNDGGIVNNGGTLEFTNSTISSNEGGIVNDEGGSLVIVSSTIADNVGGVANVDGSVVVEASIIAGTKDSAGQDQPDASGGFTSAGNNLIEDIGTSTGFPGVNDLIGQDPELEPLRANGGPTHTRLPGPQAIDHYTAAGNTLAVDQRGFLRPEGAGYDVGAVELTSCEASLVVPNVVSDAAMLNEAISCFNSTINPGTFVIELANDIGPDELVVISNSTPSLALRIDGYFHTVSSGIRVEDTTVSIDRLVLSGLDTGFSAILNVGGSISLSSLEIRDNQTHAIINIRGTLSISDSILTGNAFSNRSDRYGGAVSNLSSSDMTIVDTVISSNESEVVGGLLNLESSMRIERSTITGNRARPSIRSFEGGSDRIPMGVGGITNTGALTIVNTSILRNEGYWHAGGIYNENSMEVLFSTISGNRPGPGRGAGGIFVGGTTFDGFPVGGTTTVEGSIISGNDGNDVTIGATSLGHNIVGGVSPQDFNAAGDLIGVDPMLDPDGRPIPGSPAIDHADGALVNPQATDQRGVSRPQGAGHDAGAIEVEVNLTPGFVLLPEPCVVYSSQDAPAGSLDGPMNGQETRTIEVTGPLAGQGGAASCIADAQSTAVVVRVSSIDPLTEGNLVMTPAGVATTGGAGVVNYGGLNGLNNTNTVTIPLSTAGAVDVFANAGAGNTSPTTDVRLVVIGYYTPIVVNADELVVVNPCAVADSRPNKGANVAFAGANGYWTVGEAFPDIDVVGVFDGGQGGGNTDCGVPANATSVIVNVVSIAPVNGSGHVSVGTGGADPIDESVVGFNPLTIAPGVTGGFNNGATTTVAVDAGGHIALDIDGTVGAQTKVRVEVLGYYAPPTTTGLNYTPVTPCAVFDSRTNKGATGIFGGLRLSGETNATTYQISGAAIPTAQGGVVGPVGGTGTCGVPDGADAVLINLEAVNAVREGNLWVAAATPTAGAATTGGVLNWNNVVPKMNNANAVVIPLSALGEIDVEVNAGNTVADGTPVTEVRGVILGYYYSN